MQLISIYKEIGGLTATGLGIRVIMDDLYTESPVKCYYSYFSAEGELIEEGNINMNAPLSEDSVTALQSALEAAVGETPEMALLRMYHLGGSSYVFTYRLSGGENTTAMIEGDLITAEDQLSIKNEVLTRLSLSEAREYGPEYSTEYA